MTTITDLPQISQLAFNDLFAIDDQNNLNIFGLPTTESVSGLQIIQNTKLCLTGKQNITDCKWAADSELTVTYDNGTLGVGATLTNAGTKVAFAPNGNTAAIDDRVFVYLQGTSTGNFAHNGIYTVSVVGNGSVNWVLTRATDYNQAAEILAGTFVSMTNGTYAGLTFTQSQVNVVVGTSAIVFKQDGTSLISATNSLIVAGTYNATMRFSNTTDSSFPAGVRTLASTKGNTSGGAAATGDIGEELQVSVASGSALSLTDTVNTDIMNLAYTAGQWMITLNVKLQYSGVTNTSNLFFIGSATGDNQTGITAFNSAYIEHPPVGATGIAGGSLVYFINTASDGTLYLKVQSGFTVGTMTAYGSIQMMRIGRTG